VRIPRRDNARGPRPTNCACWFYRPDRGAPPCWYMRPRRATCGRSGHSRGVRMAPQRYFDDGGMNRAGVSGEPPETPARFSPTVCAGAVQTASRGVGKAPLAASGCSNSEAPCCRAAVRCQEGGGVQSCWTMTRSLMTLLAWSRM
jgi:hypothetical protein